MSPVRFPATPPASSRVTSPASFFARSPIRSVLLQYQNCFATIVQHVCYIVSGESPTRSVCILGEPCFATIVLILLQTNRFLLLWCIMVAKVGLKYTVTRVKIWTVQSS
jgi:hypothetical protein